MWFWSIIIGVTLDNLVYELFYAWILTFLGRNVELLSILLIKIRKAKVAFQEF